MVGHGPAVKLGKDNASDYKAKLGVKLFIVYFLVYAGFVAINLTSPTTMELEIAGQTLAVFYGIGLIVFALVLAAVYNVFCNRAEARMNK
jgi:uncharacterized membrane protein (DUF485 family)